MTWHIDGVGLEGARIAVEFWKNTNIGLKGSWLVAGPQPANSKKEGVSGIEKGYDPGYYYNIFSDVITDLEDTIKRRTGQERTDIESYINRPELSITALAIDEVRDKIAKDISAKVFKNDLVPEGNCTSVLFTLEFGGGFESELINVVLKDLHARSWAPIYALGVLNFNDTNSEGVNRVHFNTAWAIRKLLIKKRNEGIDALFLVDKKVMTDDRGKRNGQIFKCLLPMINPRKLDDGFTETRLREKLAGDISMPQIFVPCYYAANGDMTVQELLNNAVDHKLMKCDHTKADSVIIFTTLLSVKEKEEIIQWVKSNINKITDDRIHVCRVWNNTKEVLMLLRNPYGGENDPFYDRLSQIITNAIDYAKPEPSKEKVNPQILEGFNTKIQTKLSTLIMERLIPDLKK